MAFKLAQLLLIAYTAVTTLAGGQSSYPPGYSPTAFGTPGVNATFDYVVVGGGTAGLTMAARLAEGGKRVAIVEAGGFYEQDNGNLSVVPGFATFFTGSDPSDTNPLVDWGFVTTPQAGANNRRMHYARGKTLGGTSARNFMAYQRPSNGSMQRWADEVGDSSYTFDQMLPYFEKSADFHPEHPAFPSNASNKQTSNGFSQGAGPLQISYAGYVDAFTTWARLALLGVGQKAIDGFNQGKLIGSGWLTWTIDPEDGKRSSSESSFLLDVVKRNLTIKIYPRTVAQKIVFGPSNIANGVQVVTNGTNGKTSEVYMLRATEEVIISCGAFQSPQLLMISGIGPSSTLQKHGIQVLKDAPGVGQNLQDQPFWAIDRRVDLPTASAFQNNITRLWEADDVWKKNGTGPLSAFSGGYFGWEKLPSHLRKQFSSRTTAALNRFPADWPEVEYLPANAYFGYQRNYQTEDPRDGTNYASLAVALITPVSVGTVDIKSASVSDLPIINPNWLTDPADVEVAIAIFKRQREIWAQLAKLGITVGPETLPGDKVQSDADILNFIRESMIEIWHAASTCKMGKSSDKMAVIDAQARVYGVKRLRVVDASSFPFLPPGHPQSVVYALAEKIAAQILQESK